MSAKPPVTRVTRDLPFRDLGDDDFERLCVELLHCDGFEQVEHHGASGNDAGVDVWACRAGRRLAFQCKRVEEFGPAPAGEAVRKILAGSTGARQPDEIVLVVSRGVSREARLAAEQAGGEVPVSFWAGTELTAKVNRHDRLRRDFFSLPPLPLEEIPLWTVPLPPNPHFTGRQEVLTDLHTRLTTTGRAALSQVISGLGGVGKTQTAAEYCHRHRDAYHHVLWVDAGSASSLDSAYGAFARQLGLVPATEANPDLVRAAMLGWLNQQDGWLLVLDNADEPNILQPFLPTGGRGSIVITSRQHDLPGLGVASPIRLDVMTPEESVAFLLPRTAGTDHQAAADLAQDLGHLPLALEQAAAYMAVNGVGCASYLAAWRQRRLKLLERQGPQEGRYHATVATTWAVSFERVEKESLAAADVLRLVAFLAPDAIPYELFSEAAEHLGPTLAAKADELRDELGVAELLEPLARYSLIRSQPEERTFSVHRLVQEVVRESLSEAEQRRWLEHAVDGLNAVFPNPPDFKNWPRCRRLYAHAQALATPLSGLALELRSVGQLLNKSGYFADEQGRLQEALAFHRQALAVYGRVLGEEHPGTLTSMNNLAVTLKAQGDLAGARELQEQVLAVERRVLGEEHPDTLTTMNNLASTLWSQGDLAGARPLQEQVLAVRRRVLGEAHPDTLGSMNNLALTLSSQGDLACARELQEQVLAICRRVLGEEHPNTLGSMSNLGSTLFRLGELSAAHALLREAVEGARRVLGEAHPHTQRFVKNLADVEAKLTDS